LLIGTYVRFYLEALGIAVNTVPRANPDTASPAGNPFLFPGDEDLALHWCEEVGNALIRSAEWKVGQDTWDRVTGEIMHTYHETDTSYGKLLRDAIGRQTDGGTTTNRAASETFSAINRYLYVPLPFSYADGSENAFPLVATQQEQISFELLLRGRSDVIVALDTSGGPTIDDGAVAIDPSLVTGGRMLQAGFTNEVVFLDKPEQKAYADHPIEKYFEYTQGPNTRTVALGDTAGQFDDLPWNHSITSVYMFYRSNDALRAGQYEYFNFSTPLPPSARPQRNDNAGVVIPGGGLRRELNPFQCASLYVNNAPRITRQGVYWHEVAPYQRFTRSARSYALVYSFAEDPTCRTMPTGALNIGRSACSPLKYDFLDSRELTAEVIDLSPSTTYTAPTFGGIAAAGTVQVWARTQNFYKIAGQKAGLRWSAV